MDLGLEPVLERLSTKSRSSVGSNSNVGTGVSPSPSAPSLVPQSRGHKRASSAPSFTLSIAIPGMGSYDKYEHIDVPVSPVSSLNWQERLTPEELASMSSADKKRMTAIWELIVTERDYIRDLRIIIDVFMRPMSENKFGSSKNLDALFSNVDELHAINSEFLQKFEEKLAQESIIGCIGSIFLAMGIALPVTLSTAEIILFRLTSFKASDFK
ncbi:Dbl homology domain-containing protein [Chytridium lagenaria]|nr:Dbl homology domain-containing protein [Chytridium lagenaria]